MKIDVTVRDIGAERRDRNRAAGNCVNDTINNTHGKATHGVRCERCYWVHRHGKNFKQHIGAT